MHWRKSAEQNERQKRSFYLVVLAFTALIAVSTVLLVLHFPA